MSPRLPRANEDSSWISNMIDNARKGKEVSLSLSIQKEPQEEFMLMSRQEVDAHVEIELNHEPNFHGFWPNTKPNDSGHGGNDSSSLCRSQSESSGRSDEKRRTKAERTISFDVLRQYFAGSLKDAAKNLGVCPTTLKRICRQHGIDRWPSRKIQKVGHSLKKLQHMMESVQGAEGAIQLDSFYASFPKLGPNLPERGLAMSPNKQPVPEKPSSDLNLNACAPISQVENMVLSSGATTTSRTRSSCSQSSTSTTSISTGAENVSLMMNLSGVNVLAEGDSEVLKRAISEPELQVSCRDQSKLEKLMPRSLSHKLFGENISINETQLPPNIPRAPETGHFRVKATYGEEKIRFTLHSSWSFFDLQREIGRRFVIDDFSPIHLKYLDDDQEWVLLTCDADLEECIDVYQASAPSHNIRLSVHRASMNPDLNHSPGHSQPHQQFL